MSTTLRSPVDLPGHWLGCVFSCRIMIKKAVNASEDDVVIFTGSGTTGAIHKLIGVLELKGNAENTVKISKV